MRNLSGKMEIIMIRKFTEKDKSEFLTMCMAFYGGDGVDHTIPLSYAEKTFEKLLTGSPFCEAYCFEKDGKLTGYALLAFTYSNEAGGDVVWIEEVYTIPQARGTGVASKLLDYILNTYESAARFRLEITDSNKDAIRLYLKKGFVSLEYCQMEILRNK